MLDWHKNTHSPPPGATRPYEVNYPDQRLPLK